ncbi:hypothetical protein Trydic_g12730 [Trypoxylus dichotomus]
MSESEESDKSIVIGGTRRMSVQAMQSLYELQENNQLCDATIVLEDGTVVPVHRAILCACSTYFKFLTGVLSIELLSGRKRLTLSVSGNWDIRGEVQKFVE